VRGAAGSGVAVTASLFDGVDWGRVMTPDQPIVETIVRGSAVYLALVILMRVILKRQAGGLGITDLLIIVLIADAAQNAMAGGYESVTDGILLVATILVWSLIMDWLSYRFAPARWLVHPPAVPLVEDGRPLQRNLRRELISLQELMSKLREQGVEDLSEVKKACMEGDGRISVITRDGRRTREPEPVERF